MNPQLLASVTVIYLLVILCAFLVRFYLHLAGVTVPFLVRCFMAAVLFILMLR